MKATLQQNESGNIIVSTEKSNNRVIWYKNIDVEILKLSDEQIKQEYYERFKDIPIQYMKDQLKKHDGFAILNTSDDIHKKGDLVTYNKTKS